MFLNEIPSTHTCLSFNKLLACFVRNSVVQFSRIDACPPPFGGDSFVSIPHHFPFVKGFCKVFFVFSNFFLRRPVSLGFLRFTHKRPTIILLVFSFVKGVLQSFLSFFQKSIPFFSFLCYNILYGTVTFLTVKAKPFPYI